MFSPGLDLYGRANREGEGKIIKQEPNQPIFMVGSQTEFKSLRAQE